MFWLIRFEPKIVTVFRGVLYIIAAIVLLIMGAINCIQLMTPAINLNDPDLDWSTLKAGQHVEMDVDFVMGAYMTTSEDGSERSRDYMIGHLGSDEDGNLYINGMIGFKVPRGSFSRADNIAANTYEWFVRTNGAGIQKTETIHVEGTIKNMNSDQKYYASNFMTRCGFNSAEQSMYFQPLYIANNSGVGTVLLTCGIICLIIGPIVLFIGFRKTGGWFSMNTGGLFGS